MEPRFGVPLGDVRIHTDSNAARAARSLKAAAFTTGQEIYFGHERYQPETGSGRRLLAHELTHTLQQASSPGAQAKVSRSSAGVGHPTDSSEQEAERVADQVVNKDHAAAFERPKISSFSGDVAQRQGDEPGYDTAEQTKLIDEGIKDKDIGKIKQVEPAAYALASDSQAIDMIMILLNQGWVGPFDEDAIYEIWASRGKGVLDLASKYTFVWNMCLDRHVNRIWDLPELIPVKMTFKMAVGNRARVYLDANRKAVDLELKRYGLDNMATAPTPEQGQDAKR